MVGVSVKHIVSLASLNSFWVACLVRIELCQKKRPPRFSLGTNTGSAWNEHSTLPVWTHAQARVGVGVGGGRLEVGSWTLGLGVAVKSAATWVPIGSGCLQVAVGQL